MMKIFIMRYTKQIFYVHSAYTYLCLVNEKCQLFGTMVLHHLVTWNSKKMQTDVKQANICNTVLFFLTNIAYEY